MASKLARLIGAEQAQKISDFGYWVEAERDTLHAQEQELILNGQSDSDERRRVLYAEAALNEIIAGLQKYGLEASMWDD